MDNQHNTKDCAVTNVRRACSCEQWCARRARNLSRLHVTCCQLTRVGSRCVISIVSCLAVSLIHSRLSAFLPLFVHLYTCLHLVRLCFPQGGYALTHCQNNIHVTNCEVNALSVYGLVFCDSGSQNFPRYLLGRSQLVFLMALQNSENRLERDKCFTAKALKV